MSEIPTYALYGEADTAAGDTWLHWETITSRSRLYGFHIGPHRHEQFFQLLYVTSGRVDLQIDGAGYALRGPALVVVPPLAVHSYRFSEDIDGLVLTLFARDVQALLADMPQMAEAVLRPQVLVWPAGDEAHAEIAEGVSRLVAEADRTAPGQIAALKARLMLLLLALWRLGAGNPAGGSGSGGRTQALARAYQALVDAHFRETRALDFYAGKLGITPTHLNRICRKVFGAPPLAIIERRVILEARRYLQFSDLSIKEIGILLGYPDPAYFSRFFGQRTGLTPSATRRGTMAS